MLDITAMNTFGACLMKNKSDKFQKIQYVTVNFSFFHSPGDSQPLDVCSVHDQSTLVRYSVSLVGYGFYGDVLEESERHRWMGPLRYDYAGMVNKSLKISLKDRLD